MTRDNFDDNLFATALREAYAAGTAAIQKGEDRDSREITENAVRAIFSDRKYIRLSLEGQGMIPFQLMLRENGTLKYLCVHRFDDLRQGDCVFPHKNLGWLQVVEIWRPEGFISNEGCEKMTLVAIVKKIERPDMKDWNQEDGECRKTCADKH